MYVEQTKSDREPFDIDSESGIYGPGVNNPIQPVQPAEIRYCEGRWIWTIEYIQKRNGTKREDCEWLARSPETSGYDFLEFAGTLRGSCGLVSLLKQKLESKITNAQMPMIVI